MVTDPISDMLTRIRNGYLARRSEVALPWSKLKVTLAEVLKNHQYLDSFEVSGNGQKSLVLKLKYHQKEPAITEIKRISKPSLRIYVKKNNLPKVLGGMGVAIISTPMGVMTDKEARKKNIGGEVIAEIW